MPIVLANVTGTMTRFCVEVSREKLDAVVDGVDRKPEIRYLRALRCCRRRRCWAVCSVYMRSLSAVLIEFQQIRDAEYRKDEADTSRQTTLLYARVSVYRYSPSI